MQQSIPHVRCIRLIALVFPLLSAMSPEHIFQPSLCFLDPVVCSSHPFPFRHFYKFLCFRTLCSEQGLIVNGEAGFRTLRMFTYMVEGDGMDLIFAPRCMPNLEKLVIHFYCYAKNEALGSPGAFNFGIHNLSSLVTLKFELNCWGVMGSTFIAVKASLERAVRTHPNNHLNLIFDHHILRPGVHCYSPDDSEIQIEYINGPADVGQAH